MKFIHTADWHLGKLFYGNYLTDEQEWCLMNQFLPLVDEEKPDVILLAGDVYDRSVPPADAVELFDTMVSEICMKRKIPFIVITGNHDSSERLSFGSALFRGAGLYLCGDITRTVRPIVLPDAYGDVAFVPIPYVETADVRHALGNEDIRTHEDAERALSERLLTEVPDGARRIAIAHDFIAGGTTCDSERPLAIGGAEVIPADIFEPYQYTALGHLHGPQKAGGSDVIRYSGSLLKYSFSEVNQKKGVIVGDMDGLGMVTTKFVPLAPRHDVRIISGTFDELMSREDEAPDDFLLADLADDGPVIDAMMRLRTKYPHMMALHTNFGANEDSGTRLSLHEKVDMMDMLTTFTKEFAGRTLNEDEIALLNDLRRELAEDMK